MFKRIIAATILSFSLASTSTAGGHSKDIVDTAVEAGSFQTLVAAVTAAELVEVLKGEGPFTVFAPVDAAFEALPEGTLETLLKPENKDPNPKVSYYEPNAIDYQSESGRRYVLNSLRILGFIHREDKSVLPVGIKIRKPGKAFKFVKNLKVGEVETEIPNDWYKLDQEEQNFIINEVLKLKKGESFISLEDSKVI